MREILCTDKDCQILPPSQSSVDTGSESIPSVAAPGLMSENSSTVPLSSISPRSRRGRKKVRRKKKKNQVGGILKRLKRLQIGGKKKPKSKKKNQRGGGRRKFVKRKRS